VSASRHPLRLTLALALAVTLFVAGGCGDDAGDALPDVDVEPLAGGETVSLSELEGPAVINLWATWCVPCRTEIPAIEAVHQRRSDEIGFVGINVGETGPDAAEFIAEVGATYAQYLDADGRASTARDATTLPVTLVIDAAGVVVARELRAIDQDALDGLIDDALGG
jgi:cytochrome c biogenesis protein CcmG/thiol:disulfide interchange protein DsbE